MVTALIFTFIAAWNEFIVALTLTTSNRVTPLTVRLDSFIGQYTVDWQHLFGASVVATIPVLILFALIERRVVGGLTAGLGQVAGGSAPSSPPTAPARAAFAACGSPRPVGEPPPGRRTLLVISGFIRVNIGVR